MVISPNRTADCEIIFRSMGYAPQITGVDLFHPDTHAYLGFVYPSNIDMPLKRAMLAFIKDHKKQWISVTHEQIVNR